MISNISIKNKAEKTVIDIDGVIGVPEWWQFDNPEDKISTYETFKSHLNDIKDIKSKEIIVNIRSLGGDVNHALLIHDALKGTGADITTNAYGFCASAATIIHQAAKKKKRCLSENGLYLIHRVSTFTDGNVDDLKERISEMEKVENIIANIYAGNSSHDADFYKEIMGRSSGNGEWLTADEALQLELVDVMAKPENMSNYSTSGYPLPTIPQNLLKPKNMKINEAWKNFLNLLKVEKDTEITENHLESINSELTNKVTEIEGLKNAITEKDALLATKDTEITTLTNTVSEKDTKISDMTTQITNLQNELDILKADPTTTKPKEDPTENKKTANQRAYENDAKNFNS